MKKTGKISVNPTISTTSTAYGYERSPIKEVSIEKEDASYKRGPGTLDNTQNYGTLIVGQNIESDGVIEREEIKLYGTNNLGAVLKTNLINTTVIKGSVNSSLYSNG
tara:strand:- start:915 stop:1235 length:321 start_codon:yes stop_codon:yes gene_type:complete